jgi:hypothetical protein
MKTLFLLSSLLLSGCIKNNHIIEYAGKDFAHTSSLCLDALLVNMDHDMCMMPSLEMNPGIMIVECERTLSESESLWTNNIFFVVPSNSQVIIENASIICVDYNYGIFVAAPSVNQPEEAESND